MAGSSGGYLRRVCRSVRGGACRWSLCFSSGRPVTDLGQGYGVDLDLVLELVHFGEVGESVEDVLVFGSGLHEDLSGGWGTLGMKV